MFLHHLQTVCSFHVPTHVMFVLILWPTVTETDIIFVLSIHRYISEKCFSMPVDGFSQTVRSLLLVLQACSDCRNIINQSKRTDGQTGAPKPIVTFRNSDNFPKTLSQITQIIILSLSILINLPVNFQKFLAGSTRDPHSVSSRIIFLSLLLLSLFLSTSYSANIVSLLQTTSTAINSLRDLMDSPFTLSMKEDKDHIYHVNVSLILKSVNTD